jgi:hypothetical protein
MWRGVALIEDCGVVADCNAAPGISNSFLRVTQLRIMILLRFCEGIEHLHLGFVFFGFWVCVELPHNVVFHSTLVC